MNNKGQVAFPFMKYRESEAKREANQRYYQKHKLKLKQKRNKMKIHKKNRKESLPEFFKFVGEAINPFT